MELLEGSALKTLHHTIHLFKAYGMHILIFHIHFESHFPKGTLPVVPEVARMIY